MKTKKALRILLVAVLLLLPVFSLDNIVFAGQSIDYYKGLLPDNALYIPTGTPLVSANGYAFDDTYWKDPNYRVIVYGTTKDVSGNEGPLQSPLSNRLEYRYLGYDSVGNKFSNKWFKNDVDLGIENKDKHWVKNPWDLGLCTKNNYDISENSEIIKDINRIHDNESFYPNNGSTFMLYGHVQSYPTLLANGSFRMWHIENGNTYYQTFSIPHKTDKLDTPFKVSAEIVSANSTIGAAESTVDVQVKVTAKLQDDTYYTDAVQKAIHYTRDDIKKWDISITVENKSISTYVTLNPTGANTASNTFTIKLSRSQVADKERVTFTGTGRVTFQNDKYYRDSDPKIAQFTVIANSQPLPPGLSITAPAKVNVKEAYIVKVNPVVPQSESIKTVVLEARVNGGAYQPIPLSSYSASQQYNSVGTINYRATVTLTNNKTATATAATQVVDERSSDATAKIEQPNSGYEGYWYSVKNRNSFKFDGSTYNAQQASDLGVGSSDFEIQDNSQYPLESSLYHTRNYNSDTGFDIRYMQPGLYKNTIYAFPRNGTAVSDTRGIQIMRCPAIIASVDGTKKSNRKMTLDFSKTVAHPDYPLVSGKTYAMIEDTVTGEKVTCTNASNPDSTNIKTNALSGNKMDFLIKTAVDKTYKATIYVEDTRGNNDTKTITFTVAQDKAPIAKISTKSQELRNPDLSSKAEIFLQDDSCSEDGDYTTRTWEVAIDANNNGLFTDETYRAVTTLEGYQDLSGDGSQKKVRFLKTGVGKLDTRVKVKEVFGQPTIEAFVTAADRKENTATKTVEVINVAPVVDFKAFGNVKTTINLVVGSLSDTLQNTVQSLAASMQSQLIANKITPTINFIPQSFNAKQAIWNQNGGNPQNSGRSSFNGILNLNIKWQTGIGLNGNTISGNSPQLLILPNGNIFVRIDTHLYVYNKSGNLVSSLNIPMPEYSSNTVGNCVILSDGRIVVPYLEYSGNYKVILQIYNSSLVKINEVVLSNSTPSSSTIHVDANDNIYTFVQGPNNSHVVYFEVFNSNLTRITQRAFTCDYGVYDFVIDPAGYVYYQERYSQYGEGRLVKLDIYGNRIWEKNDCNDVLVFDEFENCIYIRLSSGNWSSEKKTLNKVDAATGQTLLRRTFSDYDYIGNASVDANYIYMSDAHHTIKKVLKSNFGDAGGVTGGDSPNKPVISNDGQVFSFSTLDDLTNISGGPAGFNQQIQSIDGTEAGCFAAAYGTDNTLYTLNCHVSRFGSRGQAIYENPMYVMAIGTGGTEQNIDNNLRKLRDYVPVNNTRDFTVAITETAFKDNSEANIAATANMLKSYNDNFFMIGNGSSLPDGQRILNYGTGGNLYWIDSNMWNPLGAITNSIVSAIAPVSSSKIYEYSYKKGDIINYDTFYSDYELDPSQYTWWRYYHTPKTDGIIANNGVWLGAPITQFWQNGTYTVQCIQADNTGVPSYNLQSNIAQMVIHIEDGTTPPTPTSYTPVGFIDLAGAQKQNRQLSLKLDYSSNNTYPVNASTINWTLAPISGIAASDIKYASLSAQSIDTLYRNPGRVRATVTFKDTQGNAGSATREFDIVADLAPTGTLQVTPVTYRNSAGTATINVKANVASADDYIDTLKYYITYDSDNNGSFDNNARTYLPQYDNLRDFTVDVNTGVGNYLIQVDVKEGLQEQTNYSLAPDAVDYMSTTLDWKDPNLWQIYYNGGSIVWDTTYQAWKITGEIFMYLKPEYAVKINPNNSYKMEVKVLRQNDAGKLFYWGGDRLDNNKSPLGGYGGTFDYTAAMGVLPAVGSWVTYGAAKAGPAATQYGWGNDCSYYRVGGLINYNLSNGQVTYVKDIKFLVPNVSKSVSLQAFSTVDNIAPAYDVKPEKDVYLVGEEIRFKAYDGSYLNGEASKGFFDTEKDPMTGFSVKYQQNKAVMPSQDIPSAYHNQTRTSLVNSLDRAGEYTIDINAYDDPKAGDARFDSFKRPSNTCTNKVTVHRRPVAALSFASSHGTAPVFDFGSCMYLDGTRLKISDASVDPDGFNVRSNISYKVDGSEYVGINSGDTVNLFYGSAFTFKVTTVDNWGADDTAVYTIMVVNGLDMVPEVIPQSVPASEDITLRLTTNQYTTGARTVVFGQNLTLQLKSQTAAQKVWEVRYTIPASKADTVYTAQFYAVSEGAVELRKDKNFEVRTPVNLVPDMPAEAVNNANITIKAATSIYVNNTTVQLYTGTMYQTPAFSMTGAVKGGIKNWTVDYTVPAGIPVGNYTARFTSTTPNGNTQTKDVTFRVESLKITGVTISGYWNHWRGQVDLFGKQMSTEPHRFLSLEKVKIDVRTTGYADRLEIRFSPALESMQFTDSNGNKYDYSQDYGLPYVNFPAAFNLDNGLLDNHLLWEYTLPLAPSTVGWDDVRQKSQYSMTITAWKGDFSVTYVVSDIDITGNVYDLTYIQPVD